MKTLFESPARLVKYSLTFVAFFIALGIIFASIFGFNASSEYNGYYEISIDSFDEANKEKIDNSVEAVLSSYGYKVSEKLVEDRDFCETLVYRYQSNSTQNASEISAKLIANLSLEENMISVEKLTNAYNAVTTLKYLLTIGVVSIVIVLSALIYKGTKYALSVLSAFTLTSLLSIAIVAFTRVVLSKSLVIITFVGAIFSVMSVIYLLDKLAENKEQNQALSYKDAYLNVLLNKNKLSTLAIFGMLIVSPLALILTCNFGLIMLGVGILITILVATLVAVIISPAIYILLEDSEIEKNKKIVSRSNKK